VRTNARGATVRGAGLLLLRVDRLGAVDGGEEGGLTLLGKGAGDASFRRLAGGLVDVGDGVGRLFVADGGFETTMVEACAGLEIMLEEEVVVRGGATKLVVG